MLACRIKRRRAPNIDPKAALRAHIDQLPLDRQRAFVAMATQLLAARRNNHALSMEASPRRTMRALQH